MSRIDKAWDALRAENRRETGWHLRRSHPDAPCEIFAGIHQPDSTPGLIIEVDADSLPPDLRVPKSAGFHLETILRGHAHHGRVRVTLSLARPAYAAVFAVLADDSAACAAAEPDERSALSGFVRRLHVWQDFMARHGPDGLSESAAIGLMGELYILKDYVAPAMGSPYALAAWLGPGGEPNDFALPGGFLEVKATARQAPRTITVSGADQLDNSRGRILLAHLRFRVSPDGTTLPELVESVRARLAEEAPSSLSVFTAQLLSAGYVDVHAENYIARLTLDTVEFYEVTSGFPCIGRADLRPGVLDCTYRIGLDACAPWVASDDALSSLMMAGC